MRLAPISATQGGLVIGIFAGVVPKRYRAASLSLCATHFWREPLAKRPNFFMVQVDELGRWFRLTGGIFFYMSGFPRRAAVFLFLLSGRRLRPFSGSRSHWDVLSEGVSLRSLSLAARRWGARSDHAGVRSWWNRITIPQEAVVNCQRAQQGPDKLLDAREGRSWRTLLAV